jgi:hypothetical protein
MSTATFRRPAPDDDVLIAACAPDGISHFCRLSVDDFDDPEEVEITAEEIHLTAVLQTGGPERAFPFCFRLSTTSARILVDRLRAAIERRQQGEAAP